MSEGRAAPPLLIAVGGICTTTLYRVPAVPAVPGKVLATDVAEVVDGMAVSAACAFVRLGGQGAVWGRVGDDPRGVGMRRELAAAGLDVSAVRSVPGGTSSIAVSIIDARGDRLVVPYHDASLDAAADWLPLERIASADFVHVDTRWPEGAAAALAAARAAGVPGMLDADIAPPDILARLVPLSSHAVFSDAGLFLHTGMSDLEAALRLVAAGHPGHVGRAGPMLRMVVRRLGAAAGAPFLLHPGQARQPPHLLEPAIPDRGPGQAGEQQEEGKGRDPDAGHCMEVPPHQAATPGQTGIEHPRQTLSLSRPPQIEAGDDHDDGPGGRQFHQE
jgi:sugar/nucleoside kinase (ribokinase family)